MIVLDTNVISSLVSKIPSAAVQKWLAKQPPASIFTTAISQAEIFYGLAMMPHGKRRRELEMAIQPIFDEDLAGKILPFDTDAAKAYCELMAARFKAGRPISQLDAQIAAIARSRGAAVATRNIRDFLDTGVVLIDPWQTHP